MTDFAKKKIILFSLVYLPEFVGGAEVAVDQICKQSELDEYEFHMITLGKFGTPSRRVGNIEVHYTGMFGKNKLIFFISKALFPFFSFFSFLKLHKKYNFSMIWSLMANHAAFGALFSKLAKPKVKMLLTLQEGDSTEHVMLRARLTWPLFKQIFKKADKIQVISQFLKDFALRILGQKENEKIVIIPNGVDVSAFDRDITVEERKEIRDGYGFVDSDKVIIHTGRLTYKNGLDTLVETIAILPSEFKLFLVGAGQDEKDLKNLAEKLGIKERVIFAGRKPYDELYKCLKASEIFVRLSRSEGFGNSFIEAMAAKIPVVATGVGGIVDFMRDGENGFLVTPESPVEAKEAILKASESGVAPLVEKAYALVKERYPWSNIGHAFNTLFKTCL